MYKSSGVTSKHKNADENRRIDAAEQAFYVGAANEEDMILIKAANEAKMKTKKE